VVRLAAIAAAGLSLAAAAPPPAAGPPMGAPLLDTCQMGHLGDAPRRLAGCSRPERPDIEFGNA
jgi:hypothetical protein